MAHLWFKLTFVVSYVALGLLSGLTNVLLTLRRLVLTLIKLPYRVVMGFVRFPYANVAHNLGWLFRWPWNTLVWLVTLVVLFAWLSVLITSLLGFILIWKLAPEVMLWPLGIANHCLIDADRDL